jgi:arginyl-tRNA synthetase
MLRAQIEKAIEDALQTVGVGDARFVVERPRSVEHGDYATNAALVAKVDAALLASKLKIEGVEKVEVVGTFINFHLAREVLLKEVERAAKEEEWGKSALNQGKKIMVEYTDPNPFKEFHIGHLMSNALGEAIARLLEHSGAEVIRANYQGDVGPHVAKAIWGKMQKPDASWGEAYVYGSAEYEAHKEEIDSINKKVYERSDEAVNKLYDEGRKTSLEHFEELYKTLGTKFDHYFFESETAPIGIAVVKKHPEVFEESEGAVVFKGSHTRVFINSLGLPTYEAKDLGLAELKKQKVQFDTSITITANEQDAYFDVVFEALERVHPEWKGEFKHLSHGMMRFAEGKMASRKGNVVTGESLLKDLQEDARGRGDVAVGAIKYAVLRQGSSKDIVFDPAKSLSLEGDSGPYLQYAHTRAHSLLVKAKGVNIQGSLDDAPKETHVLERILLHFPNALERAARELEPHYVTTYLTELAGAFNSWYVSERVIGGTNPQYGVLLTAAVKETLQKGLDILGIPAPEEM